MWSPKTVEDKLISQYIKKHPGVVFLEVPIYLRNRSENARRIDALILPDNETTIYERGSYSTDDLGNRVCNKSITIIEVKRSLNRPVIGQILIGKSIIEEMLEPSEVNMTVVVGKGDSDLEDYCRKVGINVEIFPMKTTTVTSNQPTPIDQRQEPNKDRQRAFLRGWDDAVKGKLYKSIRDRKTHANMGNLFGWIYGDMSMEFRIETWERYITSSLTYIYKEHQ